MDKVKLVTGTSHDEKTSEDCTSYNKLHCIQMSFKVFVLHLVRVNLAMNNQFLFTGAMRIGLLKDSNLPTHTTHSVVVQVCLRVGVEAVLVLAHAPREVAIWCSG